MKIGLEDLKRLIRETVVSEAKEEKQFYFSQPSGHGCTVTLTDAERECLLAALSTYMQSMPHDEDSRHEIHEIRVKLKQAK